MLELSEEVAERARVSYDNVKQRVYDKAYNYNIGGGEPSKLPAAVDGARGTHLEPEWEFARDVAIVYTVSDDCDTYTYIC